MRSLALGRGRRKRKSGGGRRLLRPLLGEGTDPAEILYVIWWGASSISIKKVSMGVSPISLKKNRCSRHFRPMDRRAGRRSKSFANLQGGARVKKRTWLDPSHSAGVVYRIQRCSAARKGELAWLL